MKKIFKILMAIMLAIASILPTVPSYASTTENSDEIQDAILSVEFDINDRVKHEENVILEDGNEVTVGAEPIKSNARALSGTWRIWGDNGLAKMEYYVVLAPSGKYTTISRSYGLAVTGRLTSFSNAKIRTPRKTETASASAIVEGYAQFNYLGNQWVSLWQQSGGVRATIKNNKVTTSLY